MFPPDTLQLGLRQMLLRLTVMGKILSDWSSSHPNLILGQSAATISIFTRRRPRPSL